MHSHGIVSLKKSFQSQSNSQNNNTLHRDLKKNEPGGFLNNSVISYSIPIKF